jgi:hypothetical protein
MMESYMLSMVLAITLQTSNFNRPKPGWAPAMEGTMIHLQQPKRSHSCGQHCIAMLAGVPLQSVTARFGDGATSPEAILKIAKAFGLRPQSKLWALNRDGELPKTAILKMRRPRRKYFHWACVIDGVLHDPSQEKSGQLAKCHEVVAFMPIS